jgi:hypothetical protein
MSKPEFTPGPWRVEKSGDGDLPYVTGDCAISGDICDLYHTGKNQMPKHFGDDTKHYAKHNAEANARLIAAAPELYEMLQSILTLGSLFNAGNKHVAADLEALLAKARGES